MEVGNLYSCHASACPVAQLKCRLPTALLHAGSRCTNAVDTTVSQFCQYHALQQAKTLRKAPTLNGRGSGGSSSGSAPLLGPRSQAAAALSGGAGRPAAGGLLLLQGLLSIADSSSATVHTCRCVLTSCLCPAAAWCYAAANNGKVYDARSNTWSNTSSTTQQQQLPHPSSSNKHLTPQPHPAVRSSIQSSGGSGGNSSGGRRLSLDMDANAAAVCRQVAANCAAEARRRKEAEQAELRVSAMRLVV
jgi:hypothetical protein